MHTTPESNGHKKLNKCYSDACKFINDRERLKIALIDTLIKFGVGDNQIRKIIKEVREGNFCTLHKTIKFGIK